MVFVEVGNSFFELGTSLRFFDGEIEQIDVRVESELIHRVDGPHVVQDEEQNGCSLGTRMIPLQNVEIYIKLFIQKNFHGR